MKDCPEAGSALDNEVEEGTNAASKPTVGICYRCVFFILRPAIHPIYLIF